MENKIPTAKQFSKQLDDHLLIGTTSKEKAMIEFAKLHVEAALQAASENAKIEYKKDDRHPSHWFEFIDKDSILNAYPETLIQ